jgi:hypothetical protein
MSSSNGSLQAKGDPISSTISLYQVLNQIHLQANPVTKFKKKKKMGKQEDEKERKKKRSVFSTSYLRNTFQ